METSTSSCQVSICLSLSQSRKSRMSRRMLKSTCYVENLFIKKQTTFRCFWVIQKRHYANLTWSLHKPIVCVIILLLFFDTSIFLFEILFLWPIFDRNIMWSLVEFLVYFWSNGQFICGRIVCGRKVQKREIFNCIIW